MCDLAGANEDWLVARVGEYADEHGFVERPRSEVVLRDAVRGLTDALFQAVYGVADGYAEGPARHDPIVAYGVVRARTHSPRGVTPQLWLGLLRLYRRAYIDLLALGDFEEGARLVCERFIDRVFDRFEEGFCIEWEAQSDRPQPFGPAALAD
jgi:hypothetical protein